MKFEPTPVIRPIFFWPISDRINRISLYLFCTLFCVYASSFLSTEVITFFSWTVSWQRKSSSTLSTQYFTDDAFKLTLLKLKLKLLKNKLPSPYHALDRGDKIKLILRFPRFEFFLKDDVTSIQDALKLFFKILDCRSFIRESFAWSSIT